MSDSENRFGGATNVVPAKRNKPGKVKRGVAHVVRRAKLPTGSNQASAESAPRRGVAHVVARKSAAPISEDSAVHLTPPNITVPMGKGGAAGGSSRFNPLQTNDGDEYTVEEGRPLPPRALLAIADANAAPASQALDPSQGYLVVTSGNDLGRRVGLLEGRTTIGRGMDNDIVLTDIAVSRRHMYIERRDKVYFVCDLSSGNGTHINDSERSGEILIVNGDSFRIGNTVMSFAGPEAQHDEAGSTTNWRPEAVGRGKGRRAASGEEESTVAGKGIYRGQDEPDPLTQAPTHIAPSVELASDIRQDRGAPSPARPPRAPTKPPPLPPSMASVQDAAIAAVSSIISTPPPEEISVYPLDSGELPNLSMPPTPSPAIPYPLNPPANLSPRMTAQGMPPISPPRPMPKQAIPTMGAMPGGAPRPQDLAPQGLHGPGQNLLAMGMPAHMRPGAMPGSAPMQMPMTQGSGPMPGSMGPAPMGYPGPNMGAMSHSQPMMGRLPNSGEMRGYGYESGRYPPAERGKLLIGIIAVALVLVVVGIVAAVMGQKEDAPGLAATEARTDPSTDPSSSDPAALAGDADSTGKANPESADPESTDPESADPESAEPESTDPESAEPESAEPESGNPESNTDSTAEPVLIASLIAGNSTLPASTWGTDESFLAELADIVPTAEPIVAPEPEPEITKPEITEIAKPEIAKPEKPIKRPTSNLTAKKLTTIKRPAGEDEDEDEDDEDDEEDEDDGDADDSSASAGSSKGSAGVAKAEARDLYKRRKFDEAADVLNRSADRLDDKPAEELLDLAAAYKQVGQLLASAEKVQNSDPAAALESYKKALAKDKRTGGSAHAKLIRLRIGQVAPKAAKSFMAKGRLTDAKKAADDAARYEEGAAVKAVYDSLERKADGLIKKALDAKKKGDDDKAKDLLRDATKIAPKDTEAYELSRKELKKF